MRFFLERKNAFLNFLCIIFIILSKKFKKKLQCHFEKQEKKIKAFWIQRRKGKFFQFFFIDFSFWTCPKQKMGGTLGPKTFRLSADLSSKSLQCQFLNILK
jgi:hypothetical protein